MARNLEHAPDGDGLDLDSKTTAWLKPSQSPEDTLREIFKYCSDIIRHHRETHDHYPYADKICSNICKIATKGMTHG